MPALTKSKATAKAAATAGTQDYTAWEPIENDKPEKMAVRRRVFRVHIAGNEKTAQVIENVTDETAAIAEYVTKNKLVSHSHNFRVVEMRPKGTGQKTSRQKVEA